MWRMVDVVGAKSVADTIPEYTRLVCALPSSIVMDSVVDNLGTDVRENRRKNAEIV